MYSFLYSVKIGGLTSTKELLDDLIKSIILNSFNKNFEIHLHVSENINKDLKKYLFKLNFKNIKIFNYKNQSWYEWNSDSFLKSKNFTYLALIHDDVKFETNNFDYQIHNSLKKIPNVGCVSIRDEAFLYGNFTPQFRPGFYMDIIKENPLKKGLFAEYHLQKPDWHIRNLRLKKLLKLVKLDFSIFKKNLDNFFIDFNNMDFPNKVIKVHSCWNNCIIFKTSNLHYLKSLADFQIASGLLSDEDICLEFLKNNLINVHLPKLKYLHQKSYLVDTRSFSYIEQVKKKCQKIFFDKWKFVPINDGHNLDDKLEIISNVEKYHGKNLTWSKSINSYDWNNLSL
jgi:hypothetical protein